MYDVSPLVVPSLPDESSICDICDWPPKCFVIGLSRTSWGIPLQMTLSLRRIKHYILLVCPQLDF